jgi:hypothetical protein
MKHLSAPKRPDGRHLWAWEGDRGITIARHFCWIAGSGNQKSQSALLRALLYYILSEEMHLCNLVRDHGPRKGETYSAWRTADLWFCLFEAVKKSNRQIALFIDGLDELVETGTPEGTHENLVAKLIDLGRLANVKMIVSSRPWKAFQGLEVGEDRLLRMESVKGRAILDYWHVKFSQEKTFADVNWACLYERRIACEHRHEGGHGLILTLVDKSEVNFLWTTLVAKTLSQLLKGKISLIQLSQNVEKTPGNLTDYLRDSMIMRVNPAWDAQKSMALKMSVYTLSWIPLWMLRNGNLQQLSQPDPNVPLVLAEYTLQEIRIMIKETISFLQECCRDILDLRSLTECVEINDDIFARHWYRVKASFTHRSVFDFLRRPDAQTEQLVFNNLPSIFTKEHFKAGLQITQWTIRPAKVATQPLDDLVPGT